MINLQQVVSSNEGKRSFLKDLENKKLNLYAGLLMSMSLSVLVLL